MLRLWEEVEKVLGAVLETCRVEGVFSDEEMKSLTGVWAVSDDAEEENGRGVEMWWTRVG